MLGYLLLQILQSFWYLIASICKINLDLPFYTTGQRSHWYTGGGGGTVSGQLSQAHGKNNWYKFIPWYFRYTDNHDIPTLDYQCQIHYI